MKYLIIGAGPSGLTVANRLIQLGKTDVLVLERENDEKNEVDNSDASDNATDDKKGDSTEALVETDVDNKAEVAEELTETDVDNKKEEE